MTTKKDLLLGRSRALVGGKKLTSLSDFQETPTIGARPAPFSLKETPAAMPETPPREKATENAIDLPADSAPTLESRATIPGLSEAEGQGTRLAPEAPAITPVQTRTYIDVQRRTKVATKIIRENFRFTEELAAALEQCAAERRLKKNTVVEIALEQHLKHEGYL